jgi:hypothetical protein
MLARLTLVLFVLAQMCDGVLTYSAVRTYGIGAEGNLVLATWMALVGPASTLLVAKAGAAALGCLLYLRGVHRTLAALTLFYTAGAVVPWIVLLHF